MEHYLSVVRDCLEEGISVRCHLEDITRADIYGYVVPFCILCKLCNNSRVHTVQGSFKLCILKNHRLKWCISSTFANAKQRCINTRTTIYNIFDTEKFLNRPVLCAVSNTSGLAGIAHWINTYYQFKEDEKISKSSELVAYVKAWVDTEYESGRVTVLTDDELLASFNSSFS